MKNLISLFTLATILILTSCGKEELIQPENLSKTETEVTINETMFQPIINEEEETTDTSSGPLDLTLDIEVTKVNISTFAGELLVEFSSDYDFTGQVLETNQTLQFSDASNNTHSLSFDVNSFVGTNGNLQAAFEIGQNNLTGLELKLIQSIIIQDEVME